MDMDEARRLLEQHMEGLGARSYRELEARIGQAAAEQIDLGDGRSYTIEVEVVRDGPRSTSCGRASGISQVHERALVDMPEPAPPVAGDRLALAPVSLPPSPSYPPGRRPQLLLFRGECPFISPIRPAPSNHTRFGKSVTLLPRVRSSPLSARLQGGGLCISQAPFTPLGAR
jgi:hypothetical protein